MPIGDTIINRHQARLHHMDDSVSSTSTSDTDSEASTKEQSAEIRVAAQATPISTRVTWREAVLSQRCSNRN